MPYCRALLRFIEGKREPDIRPERNELKSSRQDTDDGVFLSVETNGFTDDVGIGSELLHPKAVVQEHDPIVTRLVIADNEGSAEFRSDTDHGKVICGCAICADALRLAISSKIYTEIGLGCGQVGEDFILVLPSEIVR